MPLTKKDQKILAAMQESYHDPKKAKRVFYASANTGKLGRDVQARHGAAKKKVR